MEENKQELQEETVPATEETAEENKVNEEVAEEIAVEDAAESAVSANASDLDEATAKKKKWVAIWDKVTTGILIFLMASPFLILLYIILWIILK